MEFEIKDIVGQYKSQYPDPIKIGYSRSLELFADFKFNLSYMMDLGQEIREGTWKFKEHFLVERTNIITLEHQKYVSYPTQIEHEYSPPVEEDFYLFRVRKEIVIIQTEKDVPFMYKKLPKRN